MRHNTKRRYAAILNILGANGGSLTVTEGSAVKLLCVKLVATTTYPGSTDLGAVHHNLRRMEELGMVIVGKRSSPTGWITDILAVPEGIPADIATHMYLQRQLKALADAQAAAMPFDTETLAEAGRLAVNALLDTEPFYSEAEVDYARDVAWEEDFAPEPDMPELEEPVVCEPIDEREAIRAEQVGQLRETASYHEGYAAALRLAAQNVAATP